MGTGRRGHEDGGQGCRKPLQLNGGPQPESRGNEAIQWWVPPVHPNQLAFHVYVGDADHDNLSIGNHIGDVVQMPLTNGRCLWIVAQCEPMSDEVGQVIEQHVAGLPSDPNLMHPFTMFRHSEDAVPVLLDLASMYRPTD